MRAVGKLLFRLSLVLLPASLRGDYGAQMRATFAELQRRRVRERGVAALPRVWIREIGGVVATAWRARRPADARRFARAVRHPIDGAAPSARGPAAGLDALLQDIRYGARALGASPGFTAVALLTLALGIGANTAIFTVVHAALLRSLSFPAGDRVVLVYEDTVGDGTGMMQLTRTEYSTLRDGRVGFERVAAYRGETVTRLGEPFAVDLPALRVEPSFLSVFGLEPEMGRFFTREDAREDRPVVVVSDAMWRQDLGGSPDVVGRSLHLKGGDRVIVGVAPPQLEDFAHSTPVLLPFWAEPGEGARQAHNIHSVARLPRGVALGTIVRTASDRVQHERDSPGIEHDPTSLTFQSVREQRYGDVRRALLLLMGAAGALLLVACANVANLQLARGVGRQRELAVRQALGAGTVRIVRQLLTESGLLALAGGVLGALAAHLALPLLLARAPGALGRLDGGSVGPAVLAFTASTSMLVAIVSGLVPALWSGRPGAADGLRDAAAGSTNLGSGHLRRLLLVTQVALALVLLVGAGLLSRTFAHLRGVDVGFASERTITGYVQAGGSAYREPEAIQAFFDQVLDRLRALPGVESAALASMFPGGTGYMTMAVRVPDSTMEDAEPESILARIVSSGYFDAMGIPVRSGRDLADHARDELLVNEAFVRRYWPRGEPVGRVLEVEGFGGMTSMRVVGVAADTRNSRFDEQPPPQVYLPLSAYLWGGTNVLVRAKTVTPETVATVREAIAEVDPEVPLSYVGSLGRDLDSSIAKERFNAALMSTIAMLAAVLAAVGIYAVVRYTVGRRTQEIGVRMALGASHRGVVRMVVRQGLSTCLLGMAVGLVAAWLLSGLIGSLLHGVPPTDPLTYVGVALLLVATAALASYLPARSAASIDPVRALRQD